MRILALETSEMAGTVAAMEDDNLLTELRLTPDQGSARSLAPGIAAVLDSAGWRPREVELVAVTVGPGSFTGLRVGVTSAKAFAYCIRAAVLGIDTLETIAALAPADVRRVEAAMDAQRGEVVTATFVRHADGRTTAEGPWRLADAEQWLAALAPGTCVSGPVLRKLADRLPAGLQVLDSRYWFPTASTVGRLAFQYAQTGRRDDLWSLVPKYSRLSAAEEKWAARQSPDG